MLHRAFSTFEVKAVDESSGLITGLASTVETDRMGDIVESKGAQFKLPIPLLWQHRSDQPIGRVIDAKVTSKGIEITAKVEKDLLPRIGEAWALIKAKLVRGFSIGFRSIGEPERIEGTWGYRFKEWELLEISAVTIPANASATIQTVKQFADHPAAPGTGGGSIPGAAGASSRSTTMNVSDRITQKQAELRAKQQAMEALIGEDGDGDMSAEQQQEYDRLAVDARDITAQMGRLSALENTKSALAAPVGTVTNAADASASRGGSPDVRLGKMNTPPGIGFARAVMCKVASFKSGAMSALEVAKQMYKHDPRIAAYLKDAVAAGTTTDSSWAAPLVDQTNLATEFIEFLRPMTIIGKFGTGGIPSLRRVPFNIRVVGQTSGGAGYWVGQNAQKPVTKFDFAPTTLLWSKVAAISVISDELARFSNPSAEMLVRDGLASALVERLDVDFIDPLKHEAANVSPASITEGVTALISSGVDAEAIRQDVRAIVSAFLAVNQNPANAVWIMPNTVALALSLLRNGLGQKEFPDITMNGGFFEGLPVIASQYAVSGSPQSNLVILANASEIFLADDGGVSVEASREASIEMSDNPAVDSGTVVSMFQNNLLALKAERFINWKLRRAEAVQYMANVAWGEPGSPA